MSKEKKGFMYEIFWKKEDTFVGTLWWMFLIWMGCELSEEHCVIFIPIMFFVAMIKIGLNKYFQ